MRFGGEEVDSQTLAALRGKEGYRVQNEYQRIAEEKGIIWQGRKYIPNQFKESDLPNRLLSLANSYLYGLCLSVIMQLGYSPSLGFIHSGFSLSFIYDIADLYKTELIVPLVFGIVADKYFTDPSDVVKREIIAMFDKENLIERIEHDLEFVFNIEYQEPSEENGLWTP
jgi:CRISPR-associated protein Cas1